MRVATHDGSFHADEVFAVAALRLLGEPVEVVRTRDPDELARAEVRVDVGFRFDPASGDFDHHQRDFAEVRANGVRFASFGLVWREYGPRICDGDADLVRVVDQTLVQGVDANDVGQRLTQSLVDDIRPLSVNGVIGALNPAWDEPLDAAGELARFELAVELAEGILAREIASVAAGLRAQRIIRRAVAEAPDPRVIELPVNAPWKQVVVSEAPQALFVVYPKRQGYGVEAVPRQLGSFEHRRDLPAAWAGLQGDELITATGVPGCLFCHAKRFLVVARTREAALRLTERALAEAAEGGSAATAAAGGEVAHPIEE